MSSDIETPEFGKFARRIVRAYGRRVAHADEIDLGEMAETMKIFQESMASAIEVQLITYDRGWQWIADGLGTSRQMARYTWMPRISEEARNTLAARNEAKIRAGRVRKERQG